MMNRTFTSSMGLLFLCSFPLTALAQAPTELKAHSAPAYSISFSSDGKLLATGGFDNLIKLWEFPALKPVRQFEGHTGPVYAVVFHPTNAGQLASSSADGTIRIWNVADGKMLKEMKGHQGIVDSIAYSPDGKLLASGGQDKTVRLWDPDGAKEVKNLGAHGGAVYTVVFSPDGKLLASASQDKSAKLWDVPGQKEVKTLKGHDDAVTTVAFTADNKKVLTGGMVDRHLRIWSVVDEKPTPEQIKKANQMLAGTKVSAATTWAGQPLLSRWLAIPLVLGPDTSPGPPGGQRLDATPDDIYCITLSPDGKTAATSGYGGYLTLWDLTTGKVISSRKLPSYGAYCVRFSPDGKLLITGHDKGMCFLTPVTGK